MNTIQCAPALMAACLMEYTLRGNNRAVHYRENLCPAQDVYSVLLNTDRWHMRTVDGMATWVISSWHQASIGIPKM